MAEVHRKIELQEQDDLRYLINNVLRVANEHIDQNLPPFDGEDPLRPRVQELVYEYISQTFTLASPNIVINGLPASPEQIQAILEDPSATSTIAPNEEFAAQNPKLLERLNALQAQSDALTLEIAQLRRTAPAGIRDARIESFKQNLESDEVNLRESAKHATKDGEDVALNIKPVARQEDVEKSWEAGVKGLGELKGHMGGTAARMEGARRAGEYVLQSK